MLQKLREILYVSNYFEPSGNYKFAKCFESRESVVYICIKLNTLMCKFSWPLVLEGPFITLIKFLSAKWKYFSQESDLNNDNNKWLLFIINIFMTDTTQDQKCSHSLI